MADIARHLHAAQGYIELGMFVEASDELECIAPEDRAHPAVLVHRFVIYSEMKKWTHAEIAARHLVKLSPEDPGWWVNWAYATRRCRSIDAAKQILVDAEKLHPKDAMIQFNLGCYACQLGDLEEAKGRITEATSLDKKFRIMALYDPDLEPLWNDLAVVLKKDSEG
jgi:tetratricopeptide (TPR) repeat protein